MNELSKSWGRLNLLHTNELTKSWGGRNSGHTNGLNPKLNYYIDIGLNQYVTASVYTEP